MGISVGRNGIDAPGPRILKMVGGYGFEPQTLSV